MCYRCDREGHIARDCSERAGNGRAGGSAAGHERCRIFYMLVLYTRSRSFRPLLMGSARFRPWRIPAQAGAL